MAGTAKCPECGQEFKDNSSLALHRVFEHNAKPTDEVEKALNMLKSGNISLRDICSLVVGLSDADRLVLYGLAKERLDFVETLVWSMTDVRGIPHWAYEKILERWEKDYADFTHKIEEARLKFYRSGYFWSRKRTM